MSDYPNKISMFVVRNPYTCAISHTTYYTNADKGVVSRSNCSNTLGVSQLQRATPSLVFTDCSTAKPEQK
jgi:hypothetical protein